MRKRGVYFFVIDAFIGGAIVFVSLLLILGSYRANANRERPIVLLEDFLSFMENTELRDFQRNFTQESLPNNTLDVRNSLLEHVANLHFIGNFTMAQLFLHDVVNATLPPHLSVQFVYDEDLLYEHQVFPKANARVVLTSKKVSLININRSFVYGPNLIEVSLWSS